MAVCQCLMTLIRVVWVFFFSSLTSLSGGKTDRNISVDVDTDISVGTDIDISVGTDTDISVDTYCRG